MPPEIFLLMIKIAKKYLFLILLAVLPALSGCGTWYGFQTRMDENKDVAPLPATRLDLNGMCYSIAGMTFGNSQIFDNPLFVHVGLPLLYLIDIPFSLTTDTLAFPYDAYFIFEPRAQLHKAVEEKSFEKVKSLLEKGADPNRFFQGQTPLLLCHDVKIAQLLLMYRADVNLGDGYSSPLLLACICWDSYNREYEGNREMVKLFLKHRAKVNQQPYVARLFQSRDMEIVSLLIRHGADVNADDPLRGKSPLIYVLESNKDSDLKAIWISEMLIKNGAKINFKSKDGSVYKTPLDTVIAEHYSMEVIDFLRSKGAKTAAEVEAEREKKKK